MKKTIKTAIAMLLAAIIACGSLTAFAAAPANVNWYFGDEEPWVYSYAGELKVSDAENTVKATEENLCVYSTFEIEEAGYYRVESTNNYSGWLGIPEKSENGAYYYTMNFVSCSEDMNSKIYYFESDEYIIGFDFYEAGIEKVKIEPLGALETVEFDESAFEKLYFGLDIYEPEDEAENTDADYFVDVDSGITIKFSDGFETVLDYYTTVNVYTEETLEKGEYEVEIGIDALPDYRGKVTLNVVNIKDIISKIEMTNADKYAELVYHYNGERLSYDIEGETLTITYTDGTVETVEDFDGFYYLEEQELWIDAYHAYNGEDGYDFIIEVINERYLEIPCTYREATVSENLGQCTYNNVNEISSAFDWIGYYFEFVTGSMTASDFFGNLRFFFSQSANEIYWAFRGIISNISMLLRYYF